MDMPEGSTVKPKKSTLLTMMLLLDSFRYTFLPGVSVSQLELTADDCRAEPHGPGLLPGPAPTQRPVSRLLGSSGRQRDGARPDPDPTLPRGSVSEFDSLGEGDIVTPSRLWHSESQRLMDCLRDHRAMIAYLEPKVLAKAYSLGKTPWGPTDHAADPIINDIIAQARLQEKELRLFTPSDLTRRQWRRLVRHPADSRQSRRFIGPRLDPYEALRHRVPLPAGLLEGDLPRYASWSRLACQTQPPPRTTSAPSGPHSTLASAQPDPALPDTPLPTGSRHAMPTPSSPLERSDTHYHLTLLVIDDAEEGLHGYHLMLGPGSVPPAGDFPISLDYHEALASLLAPTPYELINDAPTLLPAAYVGEHKTYYHAVVRLRNLQRRSVQDMCDSHRGYTLMDPPPVPHHPPLWHIVYSRLTWESMTGYFDSVRPFGYPAKGIRCGHTSILGRRFRQPHPAHCRSPRAPPTVHTAYAHQVFEAFVDSAPELRQHVADAILRPAWLPDSTTLLDNSPVVTLSCYKSDPVTSLWDTGANHDYVHPDLVASGSRWRGRPAAAGIQAHLEQELGAPCGG